MTLARAGRAGATVALRRENAELRHSTSLAPAGPRDTSEGDRLPAIGDIVHYMSRGHVDRADRYRCQPAIVTDVRSTGLLCMTVFAPQSQPLWISEIPYDGQDRELGTWHWTWDCAL